MSATLLMAMTTSESLAQPFVSTYDFASVAAGANGNTDPTPPPPTATGVTFGSFTAVGYTGNPNAGGRFSWTANPLGGVDATNDFSQFTGSLSLAVYFEVAITPLSLIQLQLDSIGFTAQRSGTGIRSYAVRSSLDNYAANLPAGISPANANLGVGPGNEFRWVSDGVTTAQNGSTVTLGASFVNLTSAVTFRFYGWNAEGSGGTFSLDNVTLRGRTDNVPEPSAAALMIGWLAALGFRRLREEKL
ncbi:MAG: hypothetical protein D4R57_01285 [Verrucomicrobiales bacterium]|nr:MAG: hypothetical protein D4R57_01285 [Verrucomicrobiales bacterium]